MSDIVISSAGFNIVYNARKTLIDVLGSIGFNVDAHYGTSMVELSAMIESNQLDFCVESKTNGSDNVKSKTYVKFNDVVGIKPNKSLKAKNIEDAIDDLFCIREILKPSDRLIVVVHDFPNDTIRNYLKVLWETKHIVVNVITLKRLQFNILTHNMVPSHRVKSTTEGTDFMKKYNVQQLSELPEISRFDPVANLIGMKPDQICEIIRPSKIAIDAPYYRACVNN